MVSGWLGLLTKSGEELGGCQDRQVVAQPKQVLVACNQERAPADRESEEIIVVGIG
jgi:hypothetical protein